jgi:hypothetical protein
MRSAEHSAVHLEMRDDYSPVSPGFVAWREGYRGAPTDEASQAWRALVRETVARGVAVRRARVVSEPLSDYVQYEYDITSAHNAAAGEDVRWLSRRHTSRLMLPGNDFWIFDGKVIQFLLFAGSGALVEAVVLEDQPLVKSCAEAFEALWNLSTPHEDYRPSN